MSSQLWSRWNIPHAHQHEGLAISLSLSLPPNPNSIEGFNRLFSIRSSLQNKFKMEVCNVNLHIFCAWTGLNQAFCLLRRYYDMTTCSTTLFISITMSLGIIVLHGIFLALALYFVSFMGMSNMQVGVEEGQVSFWRMYKGTPCFWQAILSE